MNSPAPIRNAPKPLWQEIKILLHQLFALFGEPQMIARERTLTAKAHRHLCSWLAAAEAMLRQLLLLEAVALGAPAATRQYPIPKHKSPRPKRFITHDPDHPETWRMSFKVWVSSPACGGSGREAVDGGASAQASNHSALYRPLSHAARDSSPARGGATTKRFYSAWPLAERAEAILRVFNDPAPYARRLARKLFARPARAKALAGPLLHRDVVHEETAAMFSAAIAALPSGFANSS